MDLSTTTSRWQGALHTCTLVCVGPPGRWSTRVPGFESRCCITNQLPCPWLDSCETNPDCSTQRDSNPGTQVDHRPGGPTHTNVCSLSQCRAPCHRLVETRVERSTRSRLSSNRNTPATSQGETIPARGSAGIRLISQLETPPSAIFNTSK